MPLVTFLSDFGDSDHYVAAVKAAILKESSGTQIIDISHNIKKFDIIHAAHVLKSVYQDFPQGSIHLVAVNVPSEAGENLIAVKLNEHFFLTSNNGLLSLISENDPEALYSIKTTAADSIATVKDQLAPAIVQLIKGKSLKDIGKPMNLADYKRYFPLRVKATRAIIQGHVVHVDGYGNLITNIAKTDYDILSKDKSLQIKFRNYALTKVLKHYYDCKGGEAFAIFDSNGFLEIGIKEGNANQLLGLEYGSMVSIKFDDY